MEKNSEGTPEPRSVDLKGHTGFESIGSRNPGIPRTQEEQTDRSLVPGIPGFLFPTILLLGRSPREGHRGSGVPSLLLCMAMTYAEALDFLFPRTTTIKFGLDTTRQPLARLGAPHRQIPTIHIGGTNGKGSVSTLVAEALQEAGWRVGLYTSPHLVSFRERIRVDGVPITPEAVASWTTVLRPEIESTQATFFVASTVL